VGIAHDRIDRPMRNIEVAIASARPWLHEPVKGVRP
jgi:hypothetical protein